MLLIFSNGIDTDDRHLESEEEKLSRNPIIRNVALIIVFCAVAFILFTENVRTVQILGLFVCGAVVGASLTNIRAALKAKKSA